MLLALALAVVLSLAPTAQAADCGPTTFTFVGQPACVTAEFDGQRTQLENGCAVPLLIDQSVLLSADSPHVEPGASAELRDLSAFTLGMEGKLQRVVAVAEVPECPAPPPPPERGWLQGVLATVLPLGVP